MTTLGLNLLSVRPTGQLGIESFVSNVIGALQLSQEMDIHLAIRRGANAPTILSGNFFTRHPKNRVDYWPVGGTTTRIIIEMLALAASFFSNDVVLSVNNFGPLFGKRGQKRLVVIHDVWFLSERYEGSRLWQVLFRTLISLQLKVTHKVITVSEFSKRELERKLGMNAEDIHVVPNCIAKSTSTKVSIGRYEGDDISYEKEQRRYFLLIGADRKNKNVWRAVEAFASFAEQAATSVHLIVVGSYSQSYLNKLRAAYGPQLDDCINVEGYVSRERYDFLLNHADAVVFPSLYEGYGIPVIEAITANKPVLVSSGTVCAENAGAMGIVVDGTDVVSIREGYTRLAAFDSSAYRGEVEKFRKKYGNCDEAAQRLCNVIEAA